MSYIRSGISEYSNSFCLMAIHNLDRGGRRAFGGSGGANLYSHLKYELLVSMYPAWPGMSKLAHMSPRESVDMVGLMMVVMSLRGT